METLFAIISTVVFLFFAVIWGRGSIVNLALKFILTGMFIFGLIVSLKSLGYIVGG